MRQRASRGLCLLLAAFRPLGKSLVVCLSDASRMRQAMTVFQTAL
ncbi:hypothetical protein P775_19725 [Puniceibacterium antarcticum]|uniref:Uncharacterized protein n=1 Tax=Puniceibacterium antarcticum TaxID=1206336 RepID=A0A2G8RBK1_9RHOB|nr:hypothetical protein P775_19725 [Puniceibacterium antarcticum]